MILSDYYKLKRLPDIASKLRIDCVTSTASYPQIEQLRNKDCKLFVYWTNSQHTHAGQKLQADLAITKTAHISSIYTPTLKSCIGYGDMAGTDDALIFVSNEPLDFYTSDVEIFVARGYKRQMAALYTSIKEGELNDEMDGLRARAIPEGQQPTLFD